MQIKNKIALIALFCQYTLEVEIYSAETNQSSEGNKSPAINSGRDAIINNFFLDKKEKYNFQVENTKKEIMNPLKISNIDKFQKNKHILNFVPPNAVRVIRLSNINDALIHISLIGFPEKYFYTNLEHEKSILEGHADQEMSVVLMLTSLASKQKEYIFEVQDSAGGIARIAIKINDDWSEYIDQQRLKIIAEKIQGASAAELYKSAKKIITESGYKQLVEPLQDVLAGQLLASADQSEATALAYDKAKRKDSKLAEKFIGYDDKKYSYYNSFVNIKNISAAKVSSVMWRAINGDIENDASNDALIGILLANQFLTMGNISTGASGELYINGIAIKNKDEALIYIDQHAELLSPSFVCNGGYNALNTVLLDQAKTGGVLVSQHLENRGVLSVGVGAKLEANSIKIINKTRDKE